MLAILFWFLNGFISNNTKKGLLACYLFLTLCSALNYVKRQSICHKQKQWFKSFLLIGYFKFCEFRISIFRYSISNFESWISNNPSGTTAKSPKSWESGNVLFTLKQLFKNKLCVSQSVNFLMALHTVQCCARGDISTLLLL